MHTYFLKHIQHQWQNYTQHLNKKQTCWLSQARPNQLPPQGNWHTWIILAGRGFGKTRTGAETVCMWAEQNLYKRIALIGQTKDEAEHVMVFGESGLMSISQTPLTWKNNKLLWPNNVRAQTFSGDHINKLRGPQFDLVWIDEWAKYKDPEGLWNQVQMTLRLGNSPKTIITTTPRPFPFLEKLIKQPGVFVTRGSTFDNTQNLAPSFIKQMEKNYSQTTLGRQELYGDILSDSENAPWKRSLIQYQEPQKYEKVIIAVDPATTNHPKSDETGIIVAGVSNNIGYILEDLSGRFTPSVWAKRVMHAYEKYNAERIIVETNQGGNLVTQVLLTINKNLPIKAVHATRSKRARIELIVSLYEQGKVKHTQAFPDLELQMCSEVKSKSPDRVDALVWALTELMLQLPNHRQPRLWLGP